MHYLLLNTNRQSLDLIVAVNLCFSGPLLFENLLFFGVEVFAVQRIEIMSLPIFNGSLSSLNFEVDFILDVMVLKVSIVYDIVVSKACGCGLFFSLNL